MEMASLQSSHILYVSSSESNPSFLILGYYDILPKKDRCTRSSPAPRGYDAMAEITLESDGQ